MPNGSPPPAPTAKTSASRLLPRSGISPHAWTWVSSRWAAAKKPSCLSEGSCRGGKTLVADRDLPYKVIVVFTPAYDRRERVEQVVLRGGWSTPVIQQHGSPSAHDPPEQYGEGARYQVTPRVGHSQYNHTDEAEGGCTSSIITWAQAASHAVQSVPSVYSAPTAAARRCTIRSRRC